MTFFLFLQGYSLATLLKVHPPNTPSLSLAAAALLEKIDNSISRLASNPFLGRVPKDDRLKNKGYRMLVVEKYLVFYIVKNKTIQIRRIIHGARNYNFLM